MSTSDLQDWLHTNLGPPERGGKMAFIVVDTWRRHFCSTTTNRTEALCERINLALPFLRAAGARVIFTPYGFNGKHPKFVQVRATEMRNKVTPPPSRPPHRGTALCDCKTDVKCGDANVDYSISPVLKLEDGDLICNRSVNGFLPDIEYILFGGIATNLCILDRPYGIRKMIGAGYKCALIGDLSETQLLRMDMTFEEEHELVLDYYRSSVAPVLALGEIL